MSPASPTQPGAPIVRSVPSQGSHSHTSGTCRPCGFFWKSAGCHYGWSCRYCHLCSRDELKNRKKAKLKMIRQVPGFAELPVVSTLVVRPMAREAVVLPKAFNVERRCTTGVSELSRITTLLTAPRSEVTGGKLPKFAVSDNSDEGVVVVKNTFYHVMDQSEAPSPRASRRASSAPAGVMITSPFGDSDDDTENAGKGSTLHSSGRCRPCAWFWRGGGCRHGKECRHCHICPEGRVRERRRARHSQRHLPRYPTSSPIATKDSSRFASA